MKLLCWEKAICEGERKETDSQKSALMRRSENKRSALNTHKHASFRVDLVDLTKGSRDDGACAVHMYSIPLCGLYMYINGRNKSTQTVVQISLVLHKLNRSQLLGGSQSVC